MKTVSNNVDCKKVSDIYKIICFNSQNNSFSIRKNDESLSLQKNKGKIVLTRELIKSFFCEKYASSIKKLEDCYFLNSFNQNSKVRYLDHTLSSKIKIATLWCENTSSELKPKLDPSYNNWNVLFIKFEEFYYAVIKQGRYHKFDKKYVVVDNSPFCLENSSKYDISVYRIVSHIKDSKFDCVKKKNCPKLNSNHIVISTNGGINGFIPIRLVFLYIVFHFYKSNMQNIIRIGNRLIDSWGFFNFFKIITLYNKALRFDYQLYLNFPISYERTELLSDFWKEAFLSKYGLEKIKQEYEYKIESLKRFINGRITLYFSIVGFIFSVPSIINEFCELFTK